MRLPVFPNWYPYNDMLLDGHLRVGDYGVKTRSYDWDYRGPVLLYNSGRTAWHCVNVYDYPRGGEHHGIIVGVADLVLVRELTERELLKMECNFNNLTLRQVKADSTLSRVWPYPFGYFFVNTKRFRKHVPFNWPPGPVKPIYTNIRSNSLLGQQLATAPGRWEQSAIDCGLMRA